MHQGEGAGVPDPDSADQVDEQTSVGGDEEHHLLRVEHDNDWAWRRAIRRRRSTLVAYRAVVLTLGAVLVIGGLMMVPFPDPDGWSCSSVWRSSGRNSSRPNVFSTSPR